MIKLLWKRKVRKAFNRFIEHEIRYPNTDPEVTLEIMKNFRKELDK